MDREKVIKALEYCKDNQYVNDCNTCDYGGKTGTFCVRMIDDILTLLKEQEAVVRCKDCKDACIYGDDWTICTHIDSNGNDKHPVDWFCADGERKKGV